MNYLLVVDDSATDRQLVRGLLERRLPYQVEFASSGWEGLGQIESQLPQAVITDLQMPEMDGLQLTDTMRRRFATVPVILMTGHPLQNELYRMLQDGLTAWLLKPPRLKILAKLIAQSLADHP